MGSSKDEIQTKIRERMNKVSIEDISDEHIKEHYLRLADFKGISKEEFKSRRN